MTTTLLLNITGEPLGLVTLKRAVVLMIEGKAEVVEAAPTPMRSASTSMPTPLVIRLRRYVHVPYRVLAVTRRNLTIRDGNRCGYCGRHGAGTIDHIIPKAKGGTHCWENVVLACRPCNGTKGAKTLAELGWTLRVTPRPLAGPHWHVLARGRTDPAWKPYLAAA